LADSQYSTRHINAPCSRYPEYAWCGRQAGLAPALPFGGAFDVCPWSHQLLYLPQSPVRTKSILYSQQWYSEREQIIMVNRILRDDPAKGLTAIKKSATFRDVGEAWGDNSMWGFYFLGVIAYIPATPVQGYLSYAQEDRPLHVRFEYTFNTFRRSADHFDACSGKKQRIFQ
jgi:hypothetical protein